VSIGSAAAVDHARLAAAPSFGEAFRVFLRIGLLSFGGPTAQIALMHRVLVEERGWLEEQQFLNALGFCMFLPGPEAMQLATYTGWRLHGVRGGLAAGLLFVLPGALLVLTLAAIYAALGNVPIVQAIFVGIKAAVLVIVVEALLRISRRALQQPAHWVLAGLSFVAIFFFSVPFPLVIVAAALAGFVLARDGVIGTSHGESEVSTGQTLRTIVTWLLIWIVPLVAVGLVFGGDHVLAKLAVFFSKLAVVTFGGAYAVLAYMAQEVVRTNGWLDAGEMLDGLGLAETTNGPLILVTEFVGFLAAYRFGGGPPMLMGLMGALVALWATFAPCFLWIFAGAPYVERLQRAPRLKGALAGVTAAVVGVILNLSIWFALHVFFATVTPTTWGPLTLWVPDLATLDWRIVALSIVSGVALLRFHIGLAWTLLLAGGLALGWHLFFT
jgi:chromate transporter